MALSNEFAHDQLATPSMIRLIRLEEERYDGLIVCTVCHVEQTQITYQALSYCWGDDTETRQIYLRRRPDGTRHLFPVHESLWRFLNWAWNQRILSTWIWTDKICLNQRDETEKEQQIPRMCDIFHNAEKVLVWLDMTEREGKSLFYEMKYLGNPPPHERGLWKSFEILPKETQDAITKVSHLGYWERVWIVQECATAKEADIIIGNNRVSFNKFSRLMNGDWVDPLPLPQQVPPGLKRTLRVLSDLRREGGKRKLWEVLNMMSTGYYLSKNMEDRFYGAMALVAPHKDGTSPLDSIVVNKHKIPSEVLLDAVLEARPPLMRCVQWFRDILFAEQGMIQEPIFGALQHYLESERTTERHKNLASYALQACDALNIISSLPRCHCMHRMLARSVNKAFHACGRYYLFPRSLEKFLAERRGIGLYLLITPDKLYHSEYFLREPTIQDYAILMGLSISEDFNPFFWNPEDFKAFSSWKACRMSRALAHSPWRCTAHQRPGQSNERLRAAVSAQLNIRLDVKTLVKACGQYSRECDGSKMTFEIREAGFRYTIRPDDVRSSFKCQHLSTVRIEWLHTQQTLDAERERKQCA